MLTEEEARRLMQILKETASWSREDRLDRIEREIPRANAATIKLAVETLNEIDGADLRDAETTPNSRASCILTLGRGCKVG